MEDVKSCLKEQLLSNHGTELEKKSVRSKMAKVSTMSNEGNIDVYKLKKQVNQNTKDIRDI